MKNECPSRDELAGYVLGTLEERVAESIADHVDRCIACEATVEHLESSSDTVIDKLRASPPHSPYANEAGLRRAEALVAAVGREFTRGASPSTEPFSDEPALGQLGQYELLAKIGEGGMGAVYKALHTRLRRVVALKVLPAERLGNEEAIARFDREMEAVGQLNHPNIVVAHDAGEVDGQHYLVMEMVEGVNLSTLVRKKGTPPVADACEIIRQAAEGLQHAHSRGMVHRDIKPSNLMLARTDDGAAIVKVLDMGLALLDGTEPRRELTTAGQMMGTLDYMAPEQGTDTHTVDIRADVYALGASLFKLLVGEPPFPPNQYHSPLTLMMAKATGDAPSLGERRADLPAELIALVDQMLAREPDDRPATPAEVATALAGFTEGSDFSTWLGSSQSAAEPTVINVVDQSDLATHEHLTSDSQETASEPTAQPTPGSARQGDESWPAGTTVAFSPDVGSAQTKPAATRRPVFVGGALATIVAGVFIALWAAETIFKVETSDGTLVIKVTGDDFATTVQGQQVTIKNTKTDETFTIDLNTPEETQSLRPGSYFILETASGLTTKSTDFTIRSGENEVVEVRWEPKADVATNATGTGGDARAEGVASTSLREAAEWAFSRGGYYSIRIGDEYSDVRSLDDLPSTDFQFLEARFDHSMTLTDDDLRHFARWPSLGFPGLQSTGITGEGLESLRELQGVEGVWLNGCKNLDPSALEHLEGFTGLRYLGLGGTDCGDETMRRLAHWPNLDQLIVGKNVTGTGLNELIACPKLRSLCIAECLKLKPNDLRVFAQLPELNELVLDVQHMTPEFIGVIADIPQLRTLGWDSFTRDLDLSLLLPLQQLTSLSCSWQAVDDEDLVALEQMKNLKQVRLDHTAVTVEGVSRLQKALPNCELTWDGGTTER